MNLRKSILPAGEAPAPGDSRERPAEGAEALSAVAGPAEAISLTPVDSGSTFKPSEAQVRVKAKFWRAWAEQPLLSSAGAPTLQTIQAVTGSAAIKAWWLRAGFPDWFLNTQVTDERLDYLLHLALSTAEDILLSTDPRGASARVAMIKTVAELSGKFARVQAPGKGGDSEGKRRAAIENMSREDLIRLLNEAGLKVEHTVNLPAASAQATQEKTT